MRIHGRDQPQVPRTRGLSISRGAVTRSSQPPSGQSFPTPFSFSFPFWLPDAVAEGLRRAQLSPTRWKPLSGRSEARMVLPKLLHWLGLCALCLALGEGEADDGFSPVRSGLLATRQLPEGTCSPTIPCDNKACCNGSIVSFIPGRTGCHGHMLTGEQCGFDPVLHCGATCTSKCDSKADCGQFADPPGKLCPLNVCCGKYGFCGTTAVRCIICWTSIVRQLPTWKGGRADQSGRA